MSLNIVLQTTLIKKSICLHEQLEEAIGKKIFAIHITEIK